MRRFVQFNKKANDRIDSKFFHDLNNNNFSCPNTDINIDFNANTTNIKTALPEILFQPIKQFMYLFKFHPENNVLKRYILESSQQHVDKRYI